MGIRNKGNLYTEEHKQILLIEYHKSGLSKLAFCREQGIKYTTFKNWKVASADLSGANPTSTFVEIKVKDPKEKPPTLPIMIRAIHPQGVILEIPSQIEHKHLAKVLNLLGVCS